MRLFLLVSFALLLAMLGLAVLGSRSRRFVSLETINRTDRDLWLSLAADDGLGTPWCLPVPARSAGGFGQDHVLPEMSYTLQAFDGDPQRASGFLTPVARLTASGHDLLERGHGGRRAGFVLEEKGDGVTLRAGR